MVFWLLVLLGSSVYAYQNFVETKENFSEAQEAMTELRFGDAAEFLEKSKEHAKQSRQGLTFLHWVVLMPSAVDLVDSTIVILDSTEQIADSLLNLTKLADEIVKLAGVTEGAASSVAPSVPHSVGFGDLPSDVRRNILLRIASASDDFELLSFEIERALEQFDVISNQYPSIAASLEGVVEKIQDAKSDVDFVSVASRLVEQFAGVGTERSHLVLFLNNDELRPGGGFVGTFGTLNVLNGDVVSLRTTDVYHLDDLVADKMVLLPPEPLRVYNQAGAWLLRDSNWSPDFSLSARQAIRLYEEEISLLETVPEHIPQAESLDGVIALTPTFASKLLQLTGPISLSGQTFTSENIAELLEYEVGRGFKEDGTPYEQRKEIVSDLISEVLTQLFALESAHWSDAFDLAKEALDEKQLFFYSEDVRAQDVLETVGWGGVFKEQPADSFMVVDANLASLKTDPVVDRSIEYTIEPAGNRYKAQIRVHYDHTGAFDWKTSRYRTYARFYAPQGSEFIRASGHLMNDKILNPSQDEGNVDIYQELNRTVFGLFTSIEPGQSRDLLVEYYLPSSVVRMIDTGDYSLEVIKQLGARSYPLTLRLGFDKNITDALPAEDSSQWGDATYLLNTILDQDRAFRVYTTHY